MLAMFKPTKINNSCFRSLYKYLFQNQFYKYMKWHKFVMQKMNTLSIPNIISVLLFLTFLYTIWRKRNHLPNFTRKNTFITPPQPLGSWPIIGHLHLLCNENHIPLSLATLADRYGPVFSIQLGTRRAVIFSSHEAVKECFTTNDKSLSNRPESSAGEHLVYNHASCGLVDSPIWREIRKLVSLERLEGVKNCRAFEISTCINKLYCGTKAIRPIRVNMRHWIEEMILDMIVKIFAGNSYGSNIEGDEAWRFREIVRDVAHLSGQFLISDVIPFPLLRWMDLQGHIKRLKHVSKELENIVENLINERIRQRPLKGEVEEKDLIDVMLATFDDKFVAGGEPSQITIIKTAIVNVILGGYDTTSTFITKLLSVLVKHKEVLKRAQEEIDTKIGKKKWVQELNLHDLHYLNAIVKETLRLFPPLPLAIPHEASEDFSLDGYQIPKGTQLFVNLWKLHRDPHAWPEPEKFSPERFFSGRDERDDDLKFKFVPFGYGSRSCPGNKFAMELISLTVARLIQGFDFAAMEIMNDEGEIGVCTETSRENENPLELLVTPRLSCSLYELY